MLLDNTILLSACRRLFDGGSSCTLRTVSTQSLSCCRSVEEMSDLSIVWTHIQGFANRQVARMLRYNGTSVPRDYEAQVQLAIWTFRHQRVFDPESRRLAHLTPLPDSGLANDIAQLPAGTQLDPEQLDFLGPTLPDDVAAGIAAGDLNPHTLEPFGDVPPVVRESRPGSQVRNGSAGAAAARRSGYAPAQRNGIKAYFGAAPADAPPVPSGQAVAPFKAPRQSSAEGRRQGTQVGRRPRAAQLAALHARGYSSQPQLSGGAQRFALQARLLSTLIGTCFPAVM